MSGKKDHTEVYVLSDGEFYFIHWGPSTNRYKLKFIRQIVTDCGGEFLGEL